MTFFPMNTADSAIDIGMSIAGSANPKKGEKVAFKYLTVELDVNDIELIEAMLVDGAVRDHHEAIAMIAAGPTFGGPCQRVIIGQSAWRAWRGMGRLWPVWHTPGMYD